MAGPAVEGALAAEPPGGAELHPAQAAEASVIRLLSRIATACPHITKAWVDSGYRTTATDHGARLGIDVHVVHHDPTTKGFTVLPRRWTVERTFGWLMHHRRLARD